MHCEYLARRTLWAASGLIVAHYEGVYKSGFEVNISQSARIQSSRSCAHPCPPLFPPYFLSLLLNRR